MQPLHFFAISEAATGRAAGWYCAANHTHQQLNGLSQSDSCHKTVYRLGGINRPIVPSATRLPLRQPASDLGQAERANRTPRETASGVNPPACIIVQTCQVETDAGYITVWTAFSRRLSSLRWPACLPVLGLDY